MMKDVDSYANLYTDDADQETVGNGVGKNFLHGKLKQASCMDSSMEN